MNSFRARLCSALVLAMTAALLGMARTEVQAASVWPQAGTPVPDNEDTKIDVVATPVPFTRPTRAPLINDPLVRVADIGESLNSISAQTGFALNDLAQRNKLTLANALKIGQQVRLPAKAEGVYRLHQVTEFDTVFGLAAQYGVSPVAIQAANVFACAECLVPGAYVRIPQTRVTSNLPDPFEDIQITPNSPQSGDLVSIRVLTTQRVKQINGQFGNRPLRFVWDTDGYVALAGLSAIQNADVVPFRIALTTDNDQTAEVNSYLPLNTYSFGYENVYVGFGLASLLRPELNELENKELSEVFSRWSPEKRWNGVLQAPVFSDINSYFGARRNYNGGIYQGFHSGMDFKAWIGTPVKAAADGVVSKVTSLAVRGTVVVVDHGRGVFTAYCHLSEPLVKEGQKVRVGETLARSGNTGRSEGPHLHFELAVNGVQVDPLPWFRTEIK